MNAPSAVYSPGQAVSFASLTSSTVFHARIVKRINDCYYLVEDRSGLAPRPVNIRRLQADKSFLRWGGNAA